jgi:hypothetical protein
MLLAEQVERLDGFLGQANDPLRRKHPCQSPCSIITLLPAIKSKNPLAVSPRSDMFDIALVNPAPWRA